MSKTNKKLIITLVSIILVIVLLLGILLLSRNNKPKDDGWSFEDNTVTITCDSMESWEDEIPWEDLKPEIKAVKIEDNVQDICANAFSDCTELENVSIGKSVKSIGEEAFRNCSKLKEITIPEAVETVEVHAFSECRDLVIKVEHEALPSGFAENWCDSETEVVLVDVDEAEVTDTGATNTEAIEWIDDNHLYFGSYPQSKVTDSTVISALDNLAGDNKSWTSYNYYSGTGEHFDGKMKPSDYMRYKDVTYGFEKYRGVVFDEYRPDYTGGTQSDNCQERNGYTTGMVYWFKYEPVEWRILGTEDGGTIVMSEKILDSQAFNNYSLYDGEACWGNSSKTSYTCNYSQSSIREWLINDFYSTAFSTSEQNRIMERTCDNSNFNSSYSEYDSDPITTDDKVFLLSYDEVLNPDWGFDSDFSSKDSSRIAEGTDYAKCQGLYVYEGNSIWRLRSPGYSSNLTFSVNCSGNVNNYYMTEYTNYGVVPALCIVI